MTHTQPLINHLSTSRWFEVVDEAMKVVECEEREGFRRNCSSCTFLHFFKMI